MSTLHRVSYIDRKAMLTHEWFPTLFTANDRVNELDTLGMESIDFEEVEVPWDHLADLIHWLNNTPNSPNLKDDIMPIIPTPSTFDVAVGLGDPPVLSSTIPADIGTWGTISAGAFGPIVSPKGTITGFGTYSGEVDPSGLAAGAPGAKLDAGKVRPWLCMSGFARALEAVADVTTVGAAKYSDNGWMEVPDGEARYMEAFGRHMLALARGEVFDVGPTGTGARHKAQMIWNLLASLELELRAGEAP